MSATRKRFNITQEQFKRACECYGVKIRKQEGNFFQVVASVSTQIAYDDDDADAEEFEFIPWLSLCNYLVCTGATIEITNWRWKPEHVYEANITLAEAK